MLQNDVAIDYILQETGGNLDQSNCMTRLGEEMGHAIYNVTGGKNGNSAAALRNAYNGFTYVEPEKLPRNGKDDQLTSEPHSFSRVFTGAWYDILVAIYNAQRQVCLDAKKALINARDILTNYTYNAIPNAPATIRFYDSFAKAMLVQDKMNGYTYNQVMNNVFINRSILRSPIRPLAAMDLTSFKSMIGPSDELIEHPEVSTIISRNTESLTLPEFMVNVDAPNDVYYEFDSTGDCVETIGFSTMELIDHANICVDFLTEKGMIRPDRSTPFEIDEHGNLIRSHFSGCFTGNCVNPGQPEFNKCWKAENNAGCGCSNKPKPPICPPAGTTSPTGLVVINGKLVKLGALIR